MPYALAHVPVGPHPFFHAGRQAYKAVPREDMPMMQRSIGVVGVIAVLVAVAWSFSAQAAEKKKILGTTQRIRVVATTIASPDDVPNHHIVQSVVMWVTTSSDPHWNGAELIVYNQVDNIAGRGSLRGYGIGSHKDGDKSYTSHEGTFKRITKEGGAWEEITEGKFQWTGGTGKFENIKGSGTYKARTTAEGSTVNWEGEVEY